MVIPERLLRDLQWAAATEEMDEGTGATGKEWAESVAFTGRIRQTSRSVVLHDGREASVTGWRLITNFAAIDAVDRVIDGDLVYEVLARPHPVHDANGVHHFEVDLSMVEG